MFEECRFPFGRSVIVAVVLLCLGLSFTLLSLLARGHQEPSALGMANVLPVDQGANIDAPPLDGTHFPSALADEADEDPVNARFLTMVLLSASFLGASVVGWLHTNAQGQGALCLSSLGVGEVLGCAREDSLAFIGVFRL